MKLKPDTIHKVSELAVNHDELLRILGAFEEHMTEGARLYARIQQLIKQGSIPTKPNDHTSTLGEDETPNRP